MKPIIIGKYRIFRLDDCNWCIEEKNSKGKFDDNHRRYFPSFLFAILDLKETLMAEDIERDAVASLARLEAGINESNKRVERTVKEYLKQAL